MEKYTKYNIINWFLQKESMSPKKIQKLLYYTYAWGLVFFNDTPEEIENRVFEANFEGWVHGPVDSEVYATYARYGYQDIPKPSVENVIDDKDVIDLLEQVYKIYGKFSGNQLENLTHQEEPWKNSRSGMKPLDNGKKTIEDRDMFVCYATKAQS